MNDEERGAFKRAEYERIRPAFLGESGEPMDDDQLVAWRREVSRSRMVIVPPRDRPPLLMALLVITVPLTLFWFAVGLIIGRLWP